jgi:predicted CopG family antitoxin
MCHTHSHMKTITINISEPVYQDFQRYAKLQDRPTSELIRQAMEEYRQQHIRPRTTLRDLRPSSVGKVLEPLSPEDDTLEEMLRDRD